MGTNPPLGTKAGEAALCVVTRPSIVTQCAVIFYYSILYNTTIEYMHLTMATNPPLGTKAGEAALCIVTRPSIVTQCAVIFYYSILYNTTIEYKPTSQWRPIRPLGQRQVKLPCVL